MRGARRCWCVKVKLREQEATGGLPIFILNQWSRSSTMSEVLFRRCGIGNLNARRPPTQTRQILLQQQETIISDEASGPERRCLLDGGSVCAHKFSLYLGKWFQLLVSVGRGEVYLPSTKSKLFLPQHNPNAGCPNTFRPAESSLKGFRGVFARGESTRLTNLMFDCDFFGFLLFSCIQRPGRFTSQSSCSRSLPAHEQTLCPVHTLALPPSASSTCLFQWRKGSETERRTFSGL